jgi:hypothetical protein
LGWCLLGFCKREGSKKRGVDGDDVKERRWPGQVLEILKREREREKILFI